MKRIGFYDADVRLPSQVAAAVTDRKIPVLVIAAAIFLAAIPAAAALTGCAGSSPATQTSSSSSATQAGGHAGPGDYSFSLKEGALERTYLVHVPRAVAGKRSSPLVIIFHGGGGSARRMASDYGWIPESDRQGFIAVFPDGVKGPGGLSAWNAGTCCGYPQKSGIDDVGFVRDIIRDLEAGFAVDRTRIFAAGFSNGGMFAYRLGCELSRQIKAVASVAGTDNDPGCEPAVPVSVLHIHAQNDENVPFKGGPGKGPLTGGNSFNSVDATILKWVAADNLSGPPHRVLAKTGAYCDLYGSTGGTRVELCVTSTGGHSWPGGPAPAGSGATTSSAISATEMIWSFFAGS